jgi:hypothetical protein
MTNNTASQSVEQAEAALRTAEAALDTEQTFAEPIRARVNALIEAGEGSGRAEYFALQPALADADDLVRAATAERNAAKLALARVKRALAAG